jgi:hypothetical protein
MEPGKFSKVLLNENLANIFGVRPIAFGPQA